MKYIPHDNFENMKPGFDFRDYLPENKSLSVRFAKAMINSKFVFRSIVGTSLAVTGIAAVDIVWGSHNLTKILTCNVSYIDTERNQLVNVMHNTSQKDMITALEGCAQALESIDGEARTFVDYESNSGIAIPGIELIEDSPIDVGLHGANLVGDNANERLADAIAHNKSDQRWLVENYMRIAGQTYSFENLHFRYHQAGYAISDKVKYTLDDIGYWFDEQRQAFSNEISRLMGPPNQSPN